MSQMKKKKTQKQKTVAQFPAEGNKTQCELTQMAISQCYCYMRCLKVFDINSLIGKYKGGNSVCGTRGELSNGSCGQRTRTLRR